MTLLQPAPFRRIRSLGTAAAAAAVLLLVAGCGTATFTNEIQVSVADPVGVQRGEPVPVAVFDRTGSGIPEFRNEDADRVGTTSPGRPYVAELPATDTKWIGDSSGPTRVSFDLYLPQVRSAGSYGVSLTPHDGERIELAAPFRAFNAGYEAPGETPETAPPLPVIVTATAGQRGWVLTVEVLVSPP